MFYYESCSPIFYFVVDSKQRNSVWSLTKICVTHFAFLKVYKEDQDKVLNSY